MNKSIWHYFRQKPRISNMEKILIIIFLVWYSSSGAKHLVRDIKHLIKLQFKILCSWPTKGLYTNRDGWNKEVTVLSFQLNSEGRETDKEEPKGIWGETLAIILHTQGLHKFLSVSRKQKLIEGSSGKEKSNEASGRNKNISSHFLFKNVEKEGNIQWDNME